MSTADRALRHSALTIWKGRVFVGAPFLMTERVGEGADRPTPRTEPIMSIPTPSLRDLAFSTSTVAVVDELAGIDALLPFLPDALERHAGLLERLPPLLDLHGRALVHARQYQRFLALAEADPSALEDRVHTANALAILAHAGEIAVLLVPARSPEDRFVRAMLSSERSRTYDSAGGVHDPALMTRALARSGADSSGRLPVGARVPPELADAVKRFQGAVLPQPGACDGSMVGVHVLEDAHSLEAWFDTPPDLGALLDEARALFGSIEAWSEPEEPGPLWYGATRGALILAYARLCRIGLWPARSHDDLVAKLEVERVICERAADPDHMRALVEIALGVGRRIARQGPPFMTVLGGVEL